MSETSEPQPRRRSWLVALPLVVFAGLAAVFFMQLESGRDAAAIPSALIGQKAPQTSLPPVEGLNLPGLEPKDLLGKVTLVNVFGSWCAPCREEHPLLMQLSQDKRFQIVGMNQKDVPENARRFLNELGNPYAAVGADPKGRASIDWGVYGVPETFLIGKDGTIRYKQVGPLSPASLQAQMMPEIEKALAQN